MGMNYLGTRQIDGKIYVFAFIARDDAHAINITNRNVKNLSIGESDDIALLTVSSVIQFFTKPPQEIIELATWLDFSYFEGSKWSCEHTEQIDTIARLYYDDYHKNVIHWKMIHV